MSSALCINAVLSSYVYCFISKVCMINIYVDYYCNSGYHAVHVHKLVRDENEKCCFPLIYHMPPLD